MRKQLQDVTRTSLLDLLLKAGLNLGELPGDKRARDRTLAVRLKKFINEKRSDKSLFRDM